MGQAGSGIATDILTMLKEEGATEDEALSRIVAIDAPGMLMEDTRGLEPYQKKFAQKRSAVAGWKLQDPGTITLMDAVRNSGATVLIGVTAQKGLFSEEVLAQMAKNTEHPIIFGLSNPTSKSECTPEDVAKATKGMGFVATGSPFAPFQYTGKEFVTSQCNNMFIFPGMGLGALVSRATKVTSKMFLSASKALSALVKPEDRKRNMLLPNLNDIRAVSFHIAKAVAIEARDSGIGRLLRDEELERVIRKAQWEPHYYPYKSK